MNRKGEVNVGMIIMLFIVAVVGIALLVPTADTANQMTSKQTGTNDSVSTLTGFVNPDEVNETINYSIYSQSVWKVSGCPLTSVAIRNGVGTALTDDTDYTLDEANGRFSLLNTTKTIPSVAENQTYVDYTYCADGYNTNGGARSIMAIVIIFMALALMAYMLPGIKDWLG